MTRLIGLRTFVAALAVMMIDLVGCAVMPGLEDGRGAKSVVGQNLYRGLSAAEVLSARQAVQKALETHLSGNALTWSALTGASHGSVTPIRTYKTVGNFYCREYMEDVETKRFGRRSARRLACRDRDNRWKPVRRRSGA